MARPKKPETDHRFIERLEEIASHCGSRASLARAAGLTPGSVQNYFDGGEPTRRVLVALADAGRVSVEWLAAGRGGKSPEGLPEGYVAVPFFDLRAAGYSIYPFVNEEVVGFVILRQSWLERAGVSTDKKVALRAFEAATDVLGAIRAGDLIVMDESRGFPMTAGARPKASDLHVGGIYVIALGASIFIGRIRRRGKYLAAEIDGMKRPIALDPEARQFQVMGLVIWRGGTLP